MLVVMFVVLVVISLSGLLALRTVHHPSNLPEVEIITTPILEEEIFADPLPIPPSNPPPTFIVHLFHSSCELVSEPLPSYFDAMVYGELTLHDPLANCQGFRVTSDGETLYSVNA